jgi:monooxygenase
VIVTATGFDLSALGEIPFTIDGRPLAFPTPSPGTAPCSPACPTCCGCSATSAELDAACGPAGNFVCRLLDDMQQQGARVVTPQLRPDETTMPRRPWVDPDNFNPGYLMRGIHLMPKQGDHQPGGWHAGLQLKAA